MSCIVPAACYISVGLSSLCASCLQVEPFGWGRFSFQRNHYFTPGSEWKRLKTLSIWALRLQSNWLMQNLITALVSLFNSYHNAIMRQNIIFSEFSLLIFVNDAWEWQHSVRRCVSQCPVFSRNSSPCSKPTPSTSTELFICRLKYCVLSNIT
jgi:hypothetical protein